MANSEHIEWLREDAKAWNERRRRMDFELNLEEADIPEVFGLGGRSRNLFDRVDLSAFNLSRAKLRNADLHNVNLTSANLSGADLRELRLLNITRETLFPGLDEAAKAVTERFEKPADSHGK